MINNQMESQMSDMPFNELGENSKLGGITFDDGYNMFTNNINNISGLNNFDMSRISSPPEQYANSKR